MPCETILVTGGAGFIGSAFINHVFRNTDFKGRIVNLDLLTYSGCQLSLGKIAGDFSNRYVFLHGDIRDTTTVRSAFKQYNIDTVVHFAAESHVDRSIVGPDDFITTNIMGTFRLLEAAREYWGKRRDVRFHHVSTDEVFGSLGSGGFFTEDSSYDPHSPYSASKASSDHLVRSWFHTYGLQISISNCSNNYGPRQFPEKLIPVIIESALEHRDIPVYGDGLNIRDWLHVDDHADAVWNVVTRGRCGETYVVGGNSESTNIDLVKLICRLLAELTGEEEKSYTDLITFIKDRPGHDKRYAIDPKKIKQKLGWKPSRTLQCGMKETIQWYLENRDWVSHVKSDQYREWIERNYNRR